MTKLILATLLFSTAAIARDIKCEADKYPGTTFVLRVSEEPSQLRAVEGKLLTLNAASLFEIDPATLRVEGAQNSAAIEMMVETTSGVLLADISGKQIIVGKTKDGKRATVTTSILAIVKGKNSALNKDTVLEGQGRVRLTLNVEGKNESLESDSVHLANFRCTDFTDFDISTIDLGPAPK